MFLMAILSTTKKTGCNDNRLFVSANAGKCSAKWLGSLVKAKIEAENLNGRLF
jgi:hypothetical protein